MIGYLNKLRNWLTIRRHFKCAVLVDKVIAKLTPKWRPV